MNEEARRAAAVIAYGMHDPAARAAAAFAFSDHFAGRSSRFDSATFLHLCLRQDERWQRGSIVRTSPTY